MYSNLKSSDESFMNIACAMARRGLGRTRPNPSVGCVIVKDGRIIGTGRTCDGGVPHAEIMAVRNACEDVSGATMYVTLEPCCHYGKTPPCTEFIKKNGITRVVIADIDSSDKVNGGGVDYLQRNGVRVDVGVCKDIAQKNQ